MLARRRSQRSEWGRRELKVQPWTGTACRAPTGWAQHTIRCTEHSQDWLCHRGMEKSGGSHDGFLVGSGSVVQVGVRLSAGSAEGETLEGEAAGSAAASSGVVESVKPASLSALMAGRVRSRRLLM